MNKLRELVDPNSEKNKKLLIIITTEGFVVDGFLDAELKKARAIIAGEDDSPAGKRMLPWLYTQDSETEVFTNPRSWMKSTPTE